MSEEKKVLNDQELENITGGTLISPGYTSFECIHCKYRTQGEYSIQLHVKKSHGVSSPVKDKDYKKV